MWIIAKCVQEARKLQNLHIKQLCLPNADKYLHMAKFCHLFINCNGVLPIVHNRQNETTIRVMYYLLFYPTWIKFLKDKLI